MFNKFLHKNNLTILEFKKQLLQNYLYKLNNNIPINDYIFNKLYKKSKINII